MCFQNGAFETQLSQKRKKEGPSECWNILLEAHSVVTRVDRLCGVLKQWAGKKDRKNKRVLLLDDQGYGVINTELIKTPYQMCANVSFSLAHIDVCIK